MAKTLKLNSGGFVRSLTRSDLELTKRKKRKGGGGEEKKEIPIATKQLNYTDHKHFLTQKNPNQSHHHHLLALQKRRARLPQNSYP